mgnify:CR=1 FL=1
MKKRCTWPGQDELMTIYHDEEWGVPVHDDKKHFEFLILDAFQAGLSWRTILYRREGFRKAFAGFEVEKYSKECVLIEGKRAYDSDREVTYPSETKMVWKLLNKNSYFNKISKNKK